MSKPDMNDKSPNAGRWWLAFIGVLMACAGLLFAAVLWRSYQKAMETRAWSETPCEIVSSVLLSERPTPNSPMSYRASIHYRYEFQGQFHTGTKVMRVEGPTPHRDKAEKRVNAHKPGTTMTCYVNPADGKEAVLQHSGKAALYTLWFPFLFVIGGGMMAWRAVTRR
jgi:hypothetical protein